MDGNINRGDKITHAEVREYLERISKDPVTEAECDMAVAAYAAGGWLQVFDVLFSESLLDWLAAMNIAATYTNVQKAKELFVAGRTSDEVLAALKPDPKFRGIPV